MVFLFCLTHSVANAQAFQYMHPSLCDRLETVLDSIINKYSEKLQWSGKDLQDGSGYMMFENLKDKTWTLIKRKILSIIPTFNFIFRSFN